MFKKRSTNLKYGWDLNVLMASEPKSKKTQTLEYAVRSAVQYIAFLKCHSHLEPTIGVFQCKIAFSTKRYRPAGRVDNAINHTNPSVNLQISRNTS